MTMTWVVKLNYPNAEAAAGTYQMIRNSLNGKATVGRYDGHMREFTVTFKPADKAAVEDALKGLSLEIIG